MGFDFVTAQWNVKRDDGARRSTQPEQDETRTGVGGGPPRGAEEGGAGRKEKRSDEVRRGGERSETVVEGGAGGLRQQDAPTAVSDNSPRGGDAADGELGPAGEPGPDEYYSTLRSSIGRPGPTDRPRGVERPPTLGGLGPTQPANYRTSGGSLERNSYHSGLQYRFAHDPRSGIEYLNPASVMNYALNDYIRNCVVTEESISPRSLSPVHRREARRRGRDRSAHTSPRRGVKKRGKHFSPYNDAQPLVAFGRRKEVIGGPPVPKFAEAFEWEQKQKRRDDALRDAGLIQHAGEQQLPTLLKENELRGDSEQATMEMSVSEEKGGVGVPAEVEHQRGGPPGAGGVVPGAGGQKPPDENNTATMLPSANQTILNSALSSNYQTLLPDDMMPIPGGPEGPGAGGPPRDHVATGGIMLPQNQEGYVVRVNMLCCTAVWERNSSTVGCTCLETREGAGIGSRSFWVGGLVAVGNWGEDERATKLSSVPTDTTPRLHSAHNAPAPQVVTTIDGVDWKQQADQGAYYTPGASYAFQSQLKRQQEGLQSQLSRREQEAKEDLLFGQRHGGTGQFAGPWSKDLKKDLVKNLRGNGSGRGGVVVGDGRGSPGRKGRSPPGRGRKQGLPALR